MRALRGAGFWTRLGDAPKVLDTGMGDGRVVASLCAVGHHVQAYGIEIHHQLSAEVPISTNEGFDYKHLYFIALHDFQVASF